MFPNLFAMCQQHDLTVFQFKSYPHLITFTRWLVDIWKESWDNILVDASQVQLCEGDNIITWKFGGHGCFTMKSVYNALTSNDSGPYHKKVWKSKIPAKIKIFLWLVMNNAILTKDNMIKRNWQGDPSCYFCDQVETVNHLLFQCSVAKAVWAIIAVSLGANNVPRSLEQA
jgi:hypothetical protein